MAKFAQNQILVRSAALKLCGERQMLPKTTKGVPIQDALQKTGADLPVSWSAEETLVTKAHVFCPFLIR